MIIPKPKGYRDRRRTGDHRDAESTSRESFCPGGAPPPPPLKEKNSQLNKKKRIRAECFRDIAMEDEAMRMSIDAREFGAFRYSQSLLSKELGTVAHWHKIPEIEVCDFGRAPSQPPY